MVLMLRKSGIQSVESGERARERTIGGAQTGAMSVESFAEIYEQHYPRVFRYLLGRLGRRHDAEELAAEVFAKALEGLGRGSEPRHMRSWLVGIADHLVSHAWRRRAVEQRHADTEPPANEIDPEELAVGRMENAILWRCVDALEPDHRRVLLLRIAAELPAREVGAVMGRTEEAVRSLQLRALAALRRHWMEANPDARPQRSS